MQVVVGVVAPVRILQLTRRVVPVVFQVVGRRLESAVVVRFGGAAMTDPALKAASPQAPIADWFIGDDFHHNGALFLPQRPYIPLGTLRADISYGQVHAHTTYGRIGVKVVTVFPDNGKRSLPSIYGQYLLLAGTTGATLAAVHRGVTNATAAKPARWKAYAISVWLLTPCSRRIAMRGRAPVAMVTASTNCSALRRRGL